MFDVIKCCDSSNFDGLTFQMAVVVMCSASFLIDGQLGNPTKNIQLSLKSFVGLYMQTCEHPSKREMDFKPMSTLIILWGMMMIWDTLW